jgi:hypothetical protein
MWKPFYISLYYNNNMNKLYHFISALKNFLVVSTGAILAYKIVNHIYDGNFILYVFLGIGGFTVLSIYEEDLKNGKINFRRKRSKSKK